MPNKKIIKSTTITSPKYRPDGKLSGGAFGPDKILTKEINRVIERDKKTILSDPKKNPTDNSKLVFDVSSKIPMLGFSGKRITTVEASYAPQTQESRRNANIQSARQHEQNKARGTSSSTVRRIIK